MFRFSRSQGDMKHPLLGVIAASLAALRVSRNTAAMASRSGRAMATFCAPLHISGGSRSRSETAGLPPRMKSPSSVVTRPRCKARSCCKISRIATPLRSPRCCGV